MSIIEKMTKIVNDGDVTAGEQKQHHKIYMISQDHWSQP